MALEALAVVFGELLAFRGVLGWEADSAALLEELSVLGAAVPVVVSPGAAESAFDNVLQTHAWSC